MIVTEFDVSRPMWLKGEGSGDSFLLRRSDGKMCCLGFFCLAAGLSRDDIEGNQTPHDLLDGAAGAPAVVPQLYAEDGEGTPDLVNSLMSANDQRVDYTHGPYYFKDEAAREELITNLFAQMKVKVNFKD